MKNLIQILAKTIAFLSLMFAIAVGIAEAQTTIIQTKTQTAMQPTYKSLIWIDETAGVEVFLIGENSAKSSFNLMVVSDKEVKVIYHTSINSMKDVVKELTPVKTKKGISYFNVLHSFSRTTIWMALEFQVDGKRIDALTRTFYDDMFNIVPNEQFLKFPPN